MLELQFLPATLYLLCMPFCSDVLTKDVSIFGQCHITFYVNFLFMFFSPPFKFPEKNTHSSNEYHFMSIFVCAYLMPPLLSRYTYCLWFSRRAPGKHAAPQSFDQNLRLVGRFASVEQFWSYYCHLIKPCELSGHSDFHLFKDGIKPMWEVILMSSGGCTLCNFDCSPQDDANRCGGKWIVRLRKGLASRCWENLILAMLGEQFMVGDEICGAVISIRFAVRWNIQWG